jgi:hypothetical protein
LFGHKYFLNLESDDFLQNLGENEIENAEIVRDDYGQNNNYQSIVESLASGWPDNVLQFSLGFFKIIGDF